MTIPYARQSIDGTDAAAVLDTLQSAWLTQGPTIPQFEKAVAEYCGVKYAVAVNSATSALHIACLSAGLGKGDISWTSPNTFVASANCAEYCGARSDFVDIDADTGNMSIDQLRLKLKAAQRSNTLPKVLIPVHFAGHSCDMAELYKQAKQHDITVIEDASHAIGGSYRGHRIGSCNYSDMTVFSFHPVKIITSGEGGMILTNRRDLYEKLLLLRSHGITRDASLFSGDSHGPWYYEQGVLGFNYRMTDIQAALGNSQLKRIQSFVERRNAIAARYEDLLLDLPVDSLKVDSENCSAYHLYVIRLRLNEIRKTRRQVYEVLHEQGILVNVHYIPVHTQPYFAKKYGYKWGDFTESERYYQEAISLPMFYELDDDSVNKVVSALRRALG